MFLTACGNHIIDHARQILDILGHYRYANVPAGNNFPLVRNNVTMKQLHQRGLTRPVSSQKPDAFPRFNLERRAVEELGPAEAYRNIINPK
jgi:inosine-uridine nucleoside N-ribohydrolase